MWSTLPVVPDDGPVSSPTAVPICKLTIHLVQRIQRRKKTVEPMMSIGTDTIKRPNSDVK